VGSEAGANWALVVRCRFFSQYRTDWQCLPSRPVVTLRQLSAAWRSSYHFVTLWVTLTFDPSSRKYNPGEYFHRVPNVWLSFWIWAWTEQMTDGRNRARLTQGGSANNGRRSIISKHNVKHISNPHRAVHYRPSHFHAINSALNTVNATNCSCTTVLRYWVS